ncbi:adaptin-1 protein [Pluteus cervinus]|uniref:Adaptin-1 protein n=1 Tax=Pluteus cervinus TaxID=181527 RepID=A0ACD3BFJ9_9AGAR|nr:adaptin-1 protein [Pluteus cervinus]
MIQYLLIFSKQGKIRLAKWYITLPSKAKAKIMNDMIQVVLSRRLRMCNVLEYKDTKVIYKRYASLFFVCGIGHDENELMVLEIIHRYVELLDLFFGNVCELDLVYGFEDAYMILDELIVAGELQDSNKHLVLKTATELIDEESTQKVLEELGLAQLL